jgi:filamentous hemagglutinin
MSKANIKEMLNGRPPWGTDGKKIQLHHRAQQANGPLDEYTYTEHQKELKKLAHGEDYSRIDREVFDEQKARYWVSRAQKYLGLE